MSYKDEKVSVTFELSRIEAWALAQFCKRTTHQDCEDKVFQEDPYDMMRGIGAVMGALAEAGFNPR